MDTTLFCIEGLDIDFYKPDGQFFLKDCLILFSRDLGMMPKCFPMLFPVSPAFSKWPGIMAILWTKIKEKPGHISVQWFSCDDTLCIKIFHPSIDSIDKEITKKSLEFIFGLRKGEISVTEVTE